RLRRRFLDERVPFAALGTAAEPLGRRVAAALADESRAWFRHAEIIDEREKKLLGNREKNDQNLTIRRAWNVCAMSGDSLANCWPKMAPGMPSAANGKSTP